VEEIARQAGASLRDVLAISKALADEGRLRVVLALRDRELCACQIVELLELAPSTVSKHMALLRAAGLVVARKTGRWTYYRLAGESENPAAPAALQWVCRALDGDPVAAEDQQALAQILALDPEALCRQQARCS